MKVYKIEIMVVDMDQIGEEEIIGVIESTKYIHPEVKAIDSRDIGEWHDDHPLNSITKADAEYRRLFNPTNQTGE